MTGTADPLDLLVVGWYPAVDDPFAGRFIADQAAALRATGRVRPAVVSFEPFELVGDVALRDAAVETWLRVVGTSARDGDLFAARGSEGPVGVPVARLGVPHGGATGAGRTNQAVHRARVLGAALDGLGGGPWPLLHAHVGYPEGAAVAAVAARRGVPFVLTEHATYLDRLFADPDIRQAYHEGARAAARIVAVSRVLADRIAAELPDLGDRLVVIPNTVDVGAFRPVGPAERDPDELLWVGYRREVKGTPTLLRAFRRVREVRPSARLRLIGRSTTPEEEAGWLALASELGVADAVAFEPPADRAGVAAAMARAALFVHPGRNETMGIVAVEALAAGLPVVAVDSGGVTEVLGAQPGTVGALVGRQDPDELAAAILATVDRRMSFDPARLRAHVESRYASPAVAARLADLYEEVLDGRRTGAGEAPAIDTRPLHRAVVVAGFDRPRLDAALGPLASHGLAPNAVVTTGPQRPTPPAAILADGSTTAALGALLAMSGRARGRGPIGLLMAAPRWISRRWHRRRLVAAVMPMLTAAIRAGVAAAESMPAPAAAAQPEPPVVVCLGPVEALAAEPLRAAGQVTVAAGGARWLADRAVAAATGPGQDADEGPRAS